MIKNSNNNNNNSFIIINTRRRDHNESLLFSRERMSEAYNRCTLWRRSYSSFELFSPRVVHRYYYVVVSL